MGELELLVVGSCGGEDCEGKMPVHGGVIGNVAIILWVACNQMEILLLSHQTTLHARLCPVANVDWPSTNGRIRRCSIVTLLNKFGSPGGIYFWTIMLQSL